MTTEYLLEREVDYVLAALTPGNRVVCQTLLHTGLRLSDVLNLKTAQLKPRFWITEQKTGKRRMVGLPAPLLRAIQEGAGMEWAFPGRGGKGHRTRQAVWKDVKRAARAFRIPQNAAPHSFRKVYAVDVLDHYKDIEKVRRALNHDSVTTTMIYAMAAQNLEAKQLAHAMRYARRVGSTPTKTHR